VLFEIHPQLSLQPLRQALTHLLKSMKSISCLSLKNWPISQPSNKISGKGWKDSSVALMTGFPYKGDLQYSIEKSLKGKDVRGRGRHGPGPVPRAFGPNANVDAKKETDPAEDSVTISSSSDSSVSCLVDS
jgi:hypothetical protein